MLSTLLLCDMFMVNNKSFCKASCNSFVAASGFACGQLLCTQIQPEIELRFPYAREKALTAHAQKKFCNMPVLCIWRVAVSGVRQCKTDQLETNAGEVEDI